jgi:hypothetical protein
VAADGVGKEPFPDRIRVATDEPAARLARGASKAVSGRFSLEGHVQGWLGSDALDWRIERTESGTWTLNGVEATNVGNCVDLDFGFTPATNLAQMRRLDLEVGEAADAPAAWLDVKGDLTLLHQRYERRSEMTYWYEAPTFQYAALLEIAPSGFVRRYPRLWEAEA